LFTDHHLRGQISPVASVKSTPPAPRHTSYAQLRREPAPMADAPMISPHPIFRIYAALADILSVGCTPLGERRMIQILEGRVVGAKVNGRILPGGADWQIIRTDGAADVQARYVIEAEGGARVLVSSDGLRHGPPDVMAQLAAGRPVAPDLYYFRTVMRFETA